MPSLVEQQPFQSRTMVKNQTSKLIGQFESKRVHKETLSPLDTTVYRGNELPGMHPKMSEEFSRMAAPRELSTTTVRPSPKDFLARGSGLAGTSNAAAAKVAASRREAIKATAAGSPPSSGATARRPNPPNTELRRYYERSDLPVLIQQGARNKLAWKADVSRLDYHHYLPVFFSGLREIEEPYRFIAEEGTNDMLRAGGASKVLPVLPQLIVPLKEALNTRDPVVMNRALRVIQAMVGLGEDVGRALVPYYRQLLPIMAIFINHTANIGDKMDYHQRFGHIGELVQETLSKLEANGGPDAFINIKYMIPAYQSVVIA